MNDESIVYDPLLDQYAHIPCVYYTWNCTEIVYYTMCSDTVVTVVDIQHCRLPLICLRSKVAVHMGHRNKHGAPPLRRHTVAVLALVRGDDLCRVVGAPLHMLPHDALGVGALVVAPVRGRREHIQTVMGLLRGKNMFGKNGVYQCVMVRDSPESGTVCAVSECSPCLPQFAPY